MKPEEPSRAFVAGFLIGTLFFLLSIAGAAVLLLRACVSRLGT